MSDFSIYKPLRNRLRELDFNESLWVIWAYSNHVLRDDFPLPTGISFDANFMRSQGRMVLPFYLETLLREIVVNSGKGGRRSLRKWSEFAAVINMIRDFEDHVYGAHAEDLDILLEVGRITTRQFPWQSNRPNSSTLAKYIYLYNGQPITKIVSNNIGINVNEFLITCWALLGGFQSSYRISTASAAEDSGALSQDNIQRALTLCATTPEKLRLKCKAAQVFDDRYAYVFSPVRKYPIIAAARGDPLEIICPIPTLLFWRMTDGLYYECIDDRAFPTLFGSRFEQYVGELFRRCLDLDQTIITPEFEYGTKKFPRKSSDWILQNRVGTTVFVECKAKRLSWEAKSDIKNRAASQRDFHALIEAVVQTYKKIADSRNGHFGDLIPIRTTSEYALVVTLEDWGLTVNVRHNEFRQQVVDRLSEQGLNANLVNEVPFLICSSDDLLRLIQYVGAHGIDSIFGLLKERPEMQRWSVHGVLNELRRSSAVEIGNPFRADIARFSEYFKEGGRADAADWMWKFS